MAVFPHRVPDVAVVPVGEPPEAAVRCVGDVLDRELGVTTTVFEAQSAPERRSNGGLADSAALFERTADPVTEDFDLAVGVTDDGIETAVEHGVFSTTTAGGNISVVSTAPILDGAPFDDEVRARMEKLGLYAGGKLLGFNEHRGCVMQAVDTVSDIDARPAALCDDCTQRLRDPEKAPEPPEWHVTTKELEQFDTAKRWAEGDIRLTEYPLFALGWFVDALARARSKRSSGLGLVDPRSLRAFVHESYRTVRFWGLVLTYFVTFALVVAGGFRGYEALAGSQPSDMGTWFIVILGLPTAYVVQLLGRGIAAGLFAGVAEGTREGLRAEE